MNPQILELYEVLIDYELANSRLKVLYKICPYKPLAMWVATWVGGMIGRRVARKMARYREMIALQRIMEAVQNPDEEV